VRGISKRWGDALQSDLVSMAILPWAHIFGQTAELHSQLAIGCSLAISEKR
jgi:long-subunit acyl-CoA synthetase (AMP-forming)